MMMVLLSDVSQSISPGGHPDPWDHGKFRKKMGYGHKMCSNGLAESSRHAGSLPMDPGYNSHAAVEPTTPSEPGDRAV